MALECGLLKKMIGSCDDKTFRGYKNTAYIYNDTEVATVTKGNGDALITNYTLVSGKKGFKMTITGLRPFSGTGSTGVEKKFGMLFDKTITIHLKGLSPDSAVVAHILSKGAFKMLVPQEGALTSEKYVALGWETPLRASAVGWSEEEGCFVATLNEYNAELPAEFFWRTNLATTDSHVLASLPT